MTLGCLDSQGSPAQDTYGAMPKPVLPGGQLRTFHAPGFKTVSLKPKYIRIQDMTGLNGFSLITVLMGCYLCIF